MSDSIEPNDGAEPEQYTKLEAVAEYLNIKPRTLNDWALRYGNFPHLRLPGAIRVRRSEVLAWLEQFQARSTTKNEEQS
jgi:excisionase family DNA binding protein